MTRSDIIFKPLRLTLLACAALAPLAAATPASASLDAQEAAEGEDAVLVYEPAFFDEFNPQNARDMVGRVPGFSISGGGGGRGLASGLSNVLIDGRRPSSKNGPGALLSRLPAASVQRIELIRAPVPGVDMAGQDQVVNIVTDRSGGWSGAWAGRAVLFESGRLVPAGEISATRTSANTTLTLGLDLSGHANGRDSVRRRFEPDFTALSVETERTQERWEDVTASAAWQRDFDAGHTLRIDARAWTWRYNFNRFGAVTTPGGAPLGADTGAGSTDAIGAETSADYDHVLTDAWSLKLSALQRLNREEGVDVFDDFDPDGRFSGRLTLQDADAEGESVLRLEARHTPRESVSTTWALEGAYNFLDGSLDIFEGEDLTPVDLPVSETRVEEHRADASVTRVWRPSPAWTLEGAFAVELSRIAQTGDAEQERTFTYYKPEVTLSWTPNERDQLRVSARRFVGQLSFGDFISSINVNDDTSQLGNPDLEPERTWQLRADWERRFAEEGTVTLIGLYEWVEGVSDLVPIGGAFDAPGNLGDGRRWRLQMNYTTPLDALGVPGGVLSGSAMVRETMVTDPVTGVERRFRNDEDWRASIDFRQDLNALGFAWGFDYYVQGHEDFYRLDQFERVTPPRGDLDLFAEKRGIAGLTARIGADLNLGRQDRIRYVWADTRALGGPVEIETRALNNDGRVYFELSGVF
ncbi:MAG: TonB-dependent receptor [Oceanicaulis sp.]